MNYIVSGLERSGTSMMMRILYLGGAPVAFDDSRKPDENNPLGYFELEGGRIIKKIIDKEFDFKKYENKFIKVTAYGLRFLPKGNYKIIYMTRDMDEIFRSMEKMSGEQIANKEKLALIKLNNYSLNLLEKRDDFNYIVMNYNKIIEDPNSEISKLNDFLNGILNVNEAVKAVNKNLYRNRGN